MARVQQAVQVLEVCLQCNFQRSPILNLDSPLSTFRHQLPVILLTWFHLDKSAPDVGHEVDNSEFRFGNHQDTQPYSGHAGRAGSGSTGGAGYGNKTGSFSETKGTSIC
jgi:hypothetical protein